MPRIALTLQVFPDADEPRAALRVFDARTEQPLALGHHTFLLTLERDHDASFVRGQLRALDGDGASYPIQSNVAFFDMLSRWLSV